LSSVGLPYSDKWAAGAPAASRAPLR